VNRPDDSGDSRVSVAVLLKSAHIYNFKGISGGNRRFRSTIEMPKCFVFYTLTLLGIRFFEPGGQGFESLRAHFLSKKVLRQPGPRDRKRADRTPDGQQDGSTTRRRAGLDVAASAAAVRSAAEDERRSREHSAAAVLNAQRAAPKG
jgi:hypothetical protein